MTNTTNGGTKCKPINRALKTILLNKLPTLKQLSLRFRNSRSELDRAQALEAQRELKSSLYLIEMSVFPMVSIAYRTSNGNITSNIFDVGYRTLLEAVETTAKSIAQQYNRPVAEMSNLHIAINGKIANKETLKNTKLKKDDHITILEVVF